MSVFPLFLQNDGPSANQHRQLLAALYRTEGVIDSGLAVSERGAGANLSVDVAVGQCVVTGDTTGTQGRYLVTSDAVENVTISAADPSNPRIDLIVVQVDDDAVDGGGQNRAQIEVVTGTPASSPSVPATPTSALPLAQVAVAASETQIQDADITDVRDDAGPAGAGLRQTVTFTANGTFTKADYPWLRHVKITAQAGGGGGGGSGATTGSTTVSGGGGGGGACAYAWVDVADLSSSESVTVGSGGAGGGGNANGSSGGTSSFGSHASAPGGSGGTGRAASSTFGYSVGGAGGNGSSGTGDVVASGSSGGHGIFEGGTNSAGGEGGSSPLGGGGAGQSGAGVSTGGNAGRQYGGGGAGSQTGTSGSAQTGGAGAAGVVFVELFG